ncbi:MAG TPA: alpha/beta hydrolase [Ilumatobacteraceae bacterium]|nr:alpha/beta hydrolase [Ilumatobacteraceae bacterium]
MGCGSQPSGGTAPQIGQIWADEAGPEDAPLIALVHGSMDRSTGLLRLSRRLDDRWRVLRYDRRGYGRSLPHDGPYSMDHQVADLVALLAGRPAVILGHSYGGNVALATAARHPELVAALALYETPLSWEPWWPGATVGSTALAAPGGPPEAAERFMRSFIGDDAWEALPDKTRVTRRREGIAMVCELGDVRDTPPWHESAIACPVVLGYGANGAAHHAAGMRHLCELLTGTTLVEVPDADHRAPHDRPTAIAEMLVDPAIRAAGQPWTDALSLA